jgi:ferrochelatase
VTVGVLVMAYGTPRSREDIEAYYTDIRRGRTPPPDLLADLVRRYDAVLARTGGGAGDGAGFPLRIITDRQVAGIAAALDAQHPGGYAVTLGTKHSTPSIEDGVAELAGRGVERVVGLVLAPHYSTFSVGEYAGRLRAAAATYGLETDTVASWHLLPAYVEFLAGAVEAARTRLPPEAEVVFTAHSLPARILASGDPYPEQLAATAAAVAAAAGVRTWSVGWQSAGRTPEPWLGPDVLDLVRDRAAAGAAGLVVCACGFVADHLEVAYDLDIEAAGLAAELGLAFARTASVNDDPTVLAALAGLVADR